MKVLNKNPDVVLIFLDLQMPNMNGEAFLFARSMMEEVNDIPVVIMSSESNQEIVEDFMKAGVNAYHIKPFDTDEMALSVQNILEKNLKYNNTNTGYTV